MKKFNNFISLSLTVLLVLGSLGRVAAQTTRGNETYEKIEMLVADGKKIREVDVRILLKEDSFEIQSKASGEILKTMTYKDIQDAEYSYTKNPRWKTGLGLGAVGLVFFPVLFVAIPLAFTKHKRHWLTVRTDKDFAVFKLSKSNRKMFIPAFETRSSVKVTALGDDK
jgi:hypothetical protein